MITSIFFIAFTANILLALNLLRHAVPEQAVNRGEENQFKADTGSTSQPDDMATV